MAAHKLGNQTEPWIRPVLYYTPSARVYLPIPTRPRLTVNKSPGESNGAGPRAARVQCPSGRRASRRRVGHIGRAGRGGGKVAADGAGRAPRRGGVGAEFRATDRNNIRNLAREERRGEREREKKKQRPLVYTHIYIYIYNIHTCVHSCIVRRKRILDVWVHGIICTTRDDSKTRSPRRRPNGKKS